MEDNKQVHQCQFIHNTQIRQYIYEQNQAMQQIQQQIVSKSELKGTKATLQTLPQIEQICCRICLQDMSPQETFQVCKCKGANAHVHEKCLLEWAKKTQKYRESFDVYFYYCQICKDKILLEVVTKLKCLKCRQITFCGDDSCCTFSALKILFMGLAMFIAGLYLKVTSVGSDLEYLFDLTLSLSVIIISFDLILSILYFLLYNEVIVVGILLTKQQRANIRLKERKASNSHQQGGTESRKAKKQRNDNNNQTEVFFMQNTHDQQVRQILQEARFQTLNRQQQSNQSPVRQRILFPENQNLQIIPTKNHQPLHISNIHNQVQTIKPKPQPLTIDNQPNNSIHTQNQQSSPSHINNQSFIRNELQNINQRDYSTSTVQQYQTRSIMVRSISIKSRGDYKNNLSSYNSTPMNDQSSTFSKIESEISHNQIPTPKSMMVKKPNPLNRYRKTLDESMVRSEIHLRQQKRKYYGQGQNQKVSEEGQELENDVEIYFLETSNKKLQPTFQNSLSKS